MYPDIHTYGEPYTYEEHLDAWVCWDNKTSTAKEVKQQYPDDTVFLFDRDKNTYTRFTISIRVSKPIIQNGRLVFKEGETIEV